MSDEKDTSFETPEESTKKSPKKPQAAKKKSESNEKVSANEATQKLAQVHKAWGSVNKSDYQRSESDFTEEGLMLSRLCEKLPALAMIINLLDPLFFLLGIINKFEDRARETAARRQAKKEAAAQKAAQQSQTAIVYQTNEQNYPAQV